MRIKCIRYIRYVHAQRLHERLQNERHRRHLLMDLYDIAEDMAYSISRVTLVNLRQSFSIRAKMPGASHDSLIRFLSHWIKEHENCTRRK